MHRQGGSEGSLSCLHRQIGDIHRGKWARRVYRQRGSDGSLSYLHRQTGDTDKEGNRSDVCTNREGQKGHWVVCRDR